MQHKKTAQKQPLFAVCLVTSANVESTVLIGYEFFAYPGRRKGKYSNA